MTTRPSEKAVSAMIPFFTDLWGSPSAPHQMGQSLFPFIKESYKALYDLLGASERDLVIFTSSGAEAVNNAILSAYIDIVNTTGKNHFITSKIEDAPSLMAIHRLEELGCVGTLVSISGFGVITPEAFGDVITSRTAMVSLSWANGLTGVIQPIEEIAAICKQRGILLHLDATHVIGKLYFDIETLGADLISFNGDHIHAPKGTGGLWIKSGVKCGPFILGGMEQGGHRAGSYNIAGLVALGVAAKEAVEYRDLFCMEVSRLRDRLECAILEHLPEAVIFFKDQERLPHCTAIGFPGVANEALLYLLNKKGVFAGIGGGSFQQIALVLIASGVKDALASSAISFSLSRETTEEEIDLAVLIIVECVKKLMKTSEYFLKKNE